MFSHIHKLGDLVQSPPPSGLQPHHYPLASVKVFLDLQTAGQILLSTPSLKAVWLFVHKTIWSIFVTSSLEVKQLKCSKQTEWDLHISQSEQCIIKAADTSHQPCAWGVGWPWLTRVCLLCVCRPHSALQASSVQVSLNCSLPLLWTTFLIAIVTLTIAVDRVHAHSLIIMKRPDEPLSVETVPHTLYSSLSCTLVSLYSHQISCINLPKQAF